MYSCELMQLESGAMLSLWWDFFWAWQQVKMIMMEGYEGGDDEEI